MFTKPKIKFVKINDVKTPNRGTKLSSGIDFYVPNYSEDLEVFLSSQSGISIMTKDNAKIIVINPNTKIMIPSGLRLRLPKDKALLLLNKSGIASKFQLLRGACLIDADYKQEVFFNLNNVSNKPQCIEFGQKIIQGILINNYFPTMVEYKNVEKLYKDLDSTRKGGFGSTGIK